MTNRPLLTLPEPHDAFYEAPTLKKGPVTAEAAERIVIEADRVTAAAAKLDVVPDRVSEAAVKADVASDRSSATMRRAPMVERATEPAPIPLVQRTPIPEPTISVNATQELDASDVLDVRNAPVIDDDVDDFVARKPAPSRRALDTQEIRAIDRDALTGLSTIEIVRRRRRGALVAGTAIGAAVSVTLVALLTAHLASTPAGLPHAPRPGVHTLVSNGTTVARTPHRVVQALPVAPAAVAIDALPRAAAH